MEDKIHTLVKPSTSESTCDRIVRSHPRRGITIQPDPRHAEILIRDLDGKSGRAVTTPMTKDNAKESVESITEEVYEKARN